MYRHSVGLGLMRSSSSFNPLPTQQQTVGMPLRQAHSLKWLCFTIVFYTGIVIQWTGGSLMYALPQALPFHQRAGAIVWCDCSLDKGESNIDDQKRAF